uniref:Copine family member IX n=1 Tax=Xiphophorus couchianus TaxID=32473 RepID=A0A3B5LWW5_9TELE
MFQPGTVLVSNHTVCLLQGVLLEQSPLPHSALWQVLYDAVSFQFPLLHSAVLYVLTAPSTPLTLISQTFPCQFNSSVFCKFGRTEVIDNTRNPDFVRKFVLDFFFEEKQNLRFDVYNVDSRSCNISKHDFLGQTFCTLGEIIGSTGGRLERTLSIFSATSLTGACMCAGIPGKKCGVIILAAEELSNCRDIATMQLCANKLDKKDFFGKSDPFLVFYRSNEDGTFTICHKTEVIKNTLNPVWQSFTIPVRALCNGDYDRSGILAPHDFIGEFTTSYRELSRGQNQFNVYEVKNMCFCLFSFYSALFVYFDPFFYLVAFDGTLSNLLNYFCFPSYVCACVSILFFSVLQNGDSDQPNCVGIEGVLEAYFQSLRTVQLYGPTNFAPVINKVANCAAEITDGSQYFVLLMITDGVISDMVQTKEAVVNAALLPLSIIIVGVGPAEFDAMEELDGDEVRVSSRGRLAERDIVQVLLMIIFKFAGLNIRLSYYKLSVCRIYFDVFLSMPVHFHTLNTFK